MMKKSFLYFVLLLIINGCQDTNRKKEKGLISSNKMNSRKEKKYEWLPTECAPKLYPIEIHKGFLITDSGDKIKIPSGGRTVHNGWGKTGSTYIVGEDLKPVPNKLEISWLSLTERKFYTGVFDLPKQKMVNLFDDGFINRRNKKVTYSEILVGMAPGGFISVWLLGAGRTIEVATFQARETEISMKEFNPSGIQDFEKYVKEGLSNLKNEEIEQLKQEGVEIDKWELYRKSYKYNFDFQFKNNGNPENILIDFYNGESIYTSCKNTLFKEDNTYPIPNYVRYKWIDQNGDENGAKIYFDEKEIFQAFDSIFSSKKSEQVHLVLEIDKYNSDIKIYLDDNTSKILLEKLNKKVYESSK